MVFSSLAFLFLFLPACLATYYAAPGLRLRNAILAAFSLVFYAWGEPIWVSLLVVSALVDYGNGRLIERFRGRLQARLALAASLTFNIGLLASFKYSDFVVENVNALLSTQFAKPGLLLPIGISFYTFQTISYTIDVFRGDARAERSFLNFLLYIASFHQLVAGPIVRYRDVAWALENREFNVADFSHGVGRFCRGLFKKVFFANTAGALADRLLGVDPASASVGGAWLGLLMFSLQIYFDFSGYSDMAIGLGRMFGFRYNENFWHPYVSQSVTEFWRRWHISLSTFFRDYVYIPLGGSRRHLGRNLLVVWGLTGLWHGASWNFVLWGLYFALLLWAEKSLLGDILLRLPRVMRHAYTLLAIMLGWSIFRFTDLGQLTTFLTTLSGLSDRPLHDYTLSLTFWENAFWLIPALAFCAPVASRLEAGLSRSAGGVAMAWIEIPVHAALLAVSVTLLVGSTYNPFLYFRF